MVIKYRTDYRTSEPRAINHVFLQSMSMFLNTHTPLCLCVNTVTGYSCVCVCVCEHTYHDSLLVLSGLHQTLIKRDLPGETHKKILQRSIGAEAEGGRGGGGGGGCGARGQGGGWVGGGLGGGVGEVIWDCHGGRCLNRGGHMWDSAWCYWRGWGCGAGGWILARWPGENRHGAGWG